MPKYMKRPVKVDAFRLSHIMDIKYTPVWFSHAVVSETAIEDFVSGGFFIKTLEGEMFADVGDWIIRGVEGEIYPCKDSIFKKTYVRTIE